MVSAAEIFRWATPAGADIVHVRRFVAEQVKQGASVYRMARRGALRAFHVAGQVERLEHIGRLSRAFARWQSDD